MHFADEHVSLDDFLAMGLTRLRDFVPNDDERLRLIQCIFKHKASNKTLQASPQNTVRTQTL